MWSPSKPRASTRLTLLTGLLATGLLVVATPRAAEARVPLCVSFHGPSLEHAAGYQRLLESELRHHPTHRVVRRGCASKLRLEYIQLDRSAYLTGQLGAGIPHRVKVARTADLPQKIREVVAFLLKREPVFLVEHLATSGLLGRPALTLIKHGVYLFGLELSQLLVWTDTTLSFLPGAALRFRRAVDRWYLGARVSFAYNPDRLPRALDQHFIRLYGTARVEAGVYFTRDAPASLYLSGLVGVDYFQVFGPVAGTSKDTVIAMGTASLRLGVELLRLYAVRLDVFAMVSLPFHKVRDMDSSVINAYVPSLQLGCGVAF